MQRVILFFLFFFALIIFLKNAWISEDAYITFRSVEQLFAGNGPVWNPHERVQVFTSPLWYTVLVLFRVFSSDVYLNTIAASFILWFSTLLILKKILINDAKWVLSILLLTASSAFFDYTSSGLENGLAYFFIALFILKFQESFLKDNEESGKSRFRWNAVSTLLIFGIILLIRHDLVLLLAIPTIYLVIKHRSLFPRTTWCLVAAAALFPFILFSLFSITYFGFPFPNTAYAKLSTGIDKIALFHQGLKYFLSSFRYDTITLISILAALIITLIRSVENHWKYLAWGILLNLAYVCYIGGDFMQGRFLSYAYMVSVILITRVFPRIHSMKIKTMLFISVCLYVVLYPHTPVNSSVNYRNIRLDMGITDERGVYFDRLSLYRYILRDRDDLIFPRHPWAVEGYLFQKSPERIAVRDVIGMFGYYCGTDKIIIDPLALSDPLLARIPVTGSWRIGHFRRNVPPGYLESIINHDETIVDSGINAYYKRLKIVTQNKTLFTKERIKTIIFLNLGLYDHLLKPASER